MSDKKHSHYYKDVTRLTEIDVYRVLDLFGVTDHAIGHAIKKLLVAGGRGGGKDIERDVREAIDTLDRWTTMRFEDSLKGQRVVATPFQLQNTGCAEWQLRGTPPTHFAPPAPVNWAPAQGESAVAQGVDLTIDGHQQAVNAGAANGN